MVDRNYIAHFLIIPFSTLGYSMLDHRLSVIVLLCRYHYVVIIICFFLISEGISDVDVQILPGCMFRLFIKDLLYKIVNILNT